MMISIKDMLSEGINDKGIFKAIFIIGIPGAGKTTTMSKIISGSISPRIVNTDTYIEYLAKLHDVELDGNPGSYILDKSKRLTENQLALYLAGMLPLIVDGTSSNPVAIDRRRKLLESLGYDTAAVWINTNLETAWKRIQQRDRKVDREFVEEVFKSDIVNKKKLKPKFDIFLQIDNNDGMLTDNVIIDAYNKSNSFFSNPVKNSIGNDIIIKMKKNGDKYLIPNYKSKEEIKIITKKWYMR